ncbi:hypothetical protein [Flammeovirga kamogawensis]|uniref:Uncharacterized protein n=1 Tax=Flammeovirga kamogawensis TaxID=373891 RepID=A0ABX8GZD7_9BACT|nr:hypothetical protein [Flammeovirga kamogawensis]MBB6459151.1 hypothetical protein [Flammeovirga kamogawensis]QWG08717.1 hypothetical protein KM029_07200 [Flammeovirga kamogawensis]TRX67010.1 hypothetical protein EO216_02245 [Flammeovirga kamogawensis]
MKNLLILLFLSLSFFSCSDKEEPQPIVKEVVKANNTKDNTVDIVKKEKATEDTSKTKKEESKKTPTSTQTSISNKKKVTHSSGKSIFIDPLLKISASELDRYFIIKNSISKLMKEHSDYNSKWKLALKKSKDITKEISELKAKKASQSEIDAKYEAFKKETVNIFRNASKTGNLSRAIDKAQKDLDGIIITYSITE